MIRCFRLWFREELRSHWKNCRASTGGGYWSFLLLLRENPVPADYYDIRKLRGHVDTYRARIGDIRVIYEILWEDRRVNVLLIERREKAYRGI
ncbi:MAG: type II toxin-antitoxin system RelE/ParE family toxin [Candidatus Korarchaeota archaeon]|nr:type II toxin-antitoxin system RelE/ParE family toxin [Candidatus Korarchaeota archaeon]